MQAMANRPSITSTAKSAAGFPILPRDVVDDSRRSRTDQRQYKAETSRDWCPDNAERYERLEAEAFGSTIALDL